MKVSVIIPTFNRAHTIPYAIKSLLLQREDIDLDILVVDDGSSDETPKVLAELAQAHTEIRVVTQKNAGVAAARNTGILNLLPDTALVSFLDSDDLSPAGRFAADVSCFVTDPTLEATYGRLMMVSEFDYARLRPAKDARIADIIGVHLSSAIFSQSLIRRIGKFDTDFIQAEDTDYLLRVFETKTKFLQTETPCLYYLRHPGGMTKDVAESKRYFSLAIRKSILRRKADPTIRIVKPDFDVKALQATGFF